MNLDVEFQVNKLGNDADLQKDLDETTKRQRYAKDLSKDKKFVFGKYSVSGSGKVCTLFIFGEHCRKLCYARSINHGHIKVPSSYELLRLPSSISKMPS